MNLNYVWLSNGEFIPNSSLFFEIIGTKNIVLLGCYTFSSDVHFFIKNAASIYLRDKHHIKRYGNLTLEGNYSISTNIKLKKNNTILDTIPCIYCKNIVNNLKFKCSMGKINCNFEYLDF